MRFAVLLCLVAILGCGPTLQRGVVVEKCYDPPHEETVTQYIRAGKVLVPALHTNHHPERWWIKIKGRHNNQAVLDEADVSEVDWGFIQLGDHYTRPGQKGGKPCISIPSSSSGR